MKRLIFLSVFFFTIAFVSFQEANAITITATPESPSFGPNQWIIIYLNIQGYNGGPITWIAHRPDNSTISGTINQIMGGKSAVHEIVRDASDNYFGTWSIDYLYNGVKQTTISIQVNPILLTVLIDKETYYEPDIMQINITSSYYVPVAAHAGFYHIKFYDNSGNLLTNADQIDFRATQHSTVYNFPMLQLSKYYPPGLYEFKVQYYNKVVEVPFVLGEYRKFMDISAQTDKGSYLVGEDVNFNFLFTRVKESGGTLKITDPTGNTVTYPFQVYSVNTNLDLKNITNTVGTYQYNIQYSDISKEGSFKVIPNLAQLPNIETEIFLDKLNYRPGETVHAKVHSSQVISNSITTWVVDPNGKAYQKISFPVSTNDIILPHKISRTDVSGQWELYVDDGGVVKSSPFYVEGSPVDYNELLNANQFSMPVFVSTFGSDFLNPTGITIDSNGDIYVVDSGNSKIKKFDSDGKLLLSWGSAGSGNGQFVHPDGIVVGVNYVYIADTGNARIQIFDKNGTFVYAWGEYGDTPGMFHTPTTMAFDKNGELFVTDSGRGTIQIFDSHYTFTDEIRPVLTEGGNFSGTNGIVIDSQSNIYATAIDNKILKFSDSGDFMNFFGSDGVEKGRFNNPNSIALDSSGNFYVADANNHRIQKFDSDGNFILSWGSEGNTDGQFEQPIGLAIDSSDNIYVVDKGNSNIQKFALHGPVRTIAPSWVRDNTMLWSQGGLDKNEFAQAIRYLINQGSIQNLETNQTSQVKIPSWIKADASMWTSGEIDISTFIHALQYLISSGIVKV